MTIHPPPRAMYAVVVLCISVCMLGGCSSDPDYPVPAEPDAESAEITMLFNHPFYNGAPDRNNPCV